MACALLQREIVNSLERLVRICGDFAKNSYQNTIYEWLTREENWNIQTLTTKYISRNRRSSFYFLFTYFCYADLIFTYSALRRFTHIRFSSPYAQSIEHPRQLINVYLVEFKCPVSRCWSKFWFHSVYSSGSPTNSFLAPYYEFQEETGSLFYNSISCVHQNILPHTCEHLLNKNVMPDTL